MGRKKWRPGARLLPDSRLPVSPPRHRSIVAVDVEGYTTRTNPAKARLRHVLYNLLEHALHASGIPQKHRDPFVDRGDGAILLIHPVDDVPKTLLLNTLIPEMGRRLADHNNRHPEESFRLRAVVHAGEVHYDSNGPFGVAVDLACRLLDAPELKAALRNTLASLVMVVSDDIYTSIVKHRYGDIATHTFTPAVHLEFGGQRRTGWIQVVSEEDTVGQFQATRDTARVITLPPGIAQTPAARKEPSDSTRLTGD